MIRPSQIDGSSYSSSAAYYPFEVIALDHIGPLVIDEKGLQNVSVIIDAFSRWVDLGYLGRFGVPERILTDRGIVINNELVSELLHMCHTDNRLLEGGECYC
jgi:hypothetical protein